jgi:hypothetical protein
MTVTILSFSAIYCLLFFIIQEFFVFGLDRLDFISLIDEDVEFMAIPESDYETFKLVNRFILMLS